MPIKNATAKRVLIQNSKNNLFHFMRQSRATLVGILAIMSNAAVVIGVPIFFYQQHLELKRARTATTLTFIDEFQKGDLSDQRYALLEPWFEYQWQIRLLNQSKVPTAVVEKLVKDIVDSSVTHQGQPDLRRAIISMVDFFDGLFLCIETASCDNELASRYFLSYAKEFYCLYRPVVIEYQKQLSIESFGASVKEFAGGSNSCE